MLELEGDFSVAAETLGAIDGISESVETEYYVSTIVQLAHSRMSNDFDVHMNALARSNPKSFHHVYEFGAISLDRGKLWKHKLSGRGRNRVANFSFKATKIPVPRPNLAPSPSGKQISTKRHWFYWKAPVMEFGQKISYSARPGKVLIIPIGEQGIQSEERSRRVSEGRQSSEFIFARHVVNFRPGGEVQGNFSQAWLAWWGTMSGASFQKVVPMLQGDMADIIDHVAKPRSGRMANKPISISASTGKAEAQMMMVANTRKYRLEAARLATD